MSALSAAHLNNVSDTTWGCEELQGCQAKILKYFFPFLFFS